MKNQFCCVSSWSSNCYHHYFSVVSSVEYLEVYKFHYHMTLNPFLFTIFCYGEKVIGWCCGWWRRARIHCWLHFVYICIGEIMLKRDKKKYWNFHVIFLCKFTCAAEAIELNACDDFTSSNNLFFRFANIFFTLNTTFYKYKIIYFSNINKKYTILRRVVLRYTIQMNSSSS